MAVSANSARSLVYPFIPDPNTCAIATLKNDDATYGLSFTYWLSSPASAPEPRRPRTSALDRCPAKARLCIGPDEQPVENVCVPERDFKRLRTAGILSEQIADIGSWTMRRCNC